MWFYLIEKEMKQMMRSVILPVVFVLLPVMMMNVVPRIATQEVKNLNIVIVDNDHSTLSQRLVQKLSASAWFRLVDCPATYAAAEEHIKRGTADIIVEIASDLERSLMRGEDGAIQISANATNGTKSGLGTSYISQMIADFALSTLHPSPFTNHPVATRFLYNQRLDYKIYMIPAVIAMILTLLMGFLPALNIVMEKERGTIEQINVTPVGRVAFILSKVVPYWLAGAFILFYSMLLGGLFHDIWPAGSVWTVFVLTTLFIVVASSLGLVVSNYSDTIQQAALVMYFFLVVFLLLSGLLTPVGSMPGWAQLLTELNPLRHFIEPLRIVYVKGASLAELAPYLWRLALMGVLSSAWALWSYRKSSS
ncbi:MAG: ABC transporter permease [Prevotella sp.]|nr:ABC transporter permease [Prevotella sp.]